MSAFQMYIDDSYGFTPLNGPPYNAAAPTSTKWFFTLVPYLSGRLSKPCPVLECPSRDESWGKSNYSQPYNWGYPRLYRAPANWKPISGSTGWAGGGIPITAIKHPSGLMAFGEAEPYYKTFNTTNRYHYAGLFDITNGAGYDIFKPYIHGQGMNSAFVDSHVEFLLGDYIELELAKGTQGSGSTLLADRD